MRFLVYVEMLVETDSDLLNAKDREVQCQNDAFDFVDEILVEATRRPEFLAGQIKRIDRSIRRNL